MDVDRFYKLRRLQSSIQGVLSIEAVDPAGRATPPGGATATPPGGAPPHIRCGASIPKSSRPVASVRAVSAHKASREARSAGSDLSTGHSWKKVEKLEARLYR